MNERPTPETDAAEYLISIGRTKEEWMVRSDVSRKLERERDEAREAYELLSGKWQKADKQLSSALRERDEAQRACQLAHDRLLRGDNDSEILDILAKGWRAAK